MIAPMRLMAACSKSKSEYCGIAEVFIKLALKDSPVSGRKGFAVCF